MANPKFVIFSAIHDFPVDVAMGNLGGKLFEIVGDDKKYLNFDVTRQWI